MLREDANGNVYDDGIPSWVDTTPQPLQNPDASPAEIAAYRTARAVKGHGLPVADDRYSWLGPKDAVRPSYIMEPTLEEAQGGMTLPTGLMQRDDGTFYYADTGQNVPVVRRPGVLPIANTPEGFKFATPKLLDLVGNVMGNVGGPLKVATKGNEMVLGAGMVRKMPEWEIKGFEGQDWFHGTTHEFEKFSKAKGNPENHLGQYPHFTTSPEDAAANYAGHGPDLTGRIERRAEEILANPKGDEVEPAWGTPEYKAVYEKAKEQATKELAGPHEGAIIPAKMKLQNPVSLVDDKPTWIDFAPKYNKEGEWVKENPNTLKLLNSLKRQGEKYGFDGQKVFDDISEKTELYDTVRAKDLDEALRSSDYMLDAQNEKGALVSSHVISEVFKDLGFDGIVMDAKQAFPNMKNIPEGTLHAVPLKQNTVKGKYNDKILFSDTRNQVASQTAQQIEKGPFYSTLERAVENSKINLATPEQWLGYLKNQPGVKAEELNTVLKDLPKEGMLSRGQLDKFVKQNKVELKEKVLGGYDSGKLDEAKYRKDLEELSNGYYDQLGASEQGRIREQALERQKLAPTKYHQWQLPSGENYKEMLLSLSNKEREAFEAKKNDVFTRREKIQDEFDALHGKDDLETLKRRKILTGQFNDLTKQLQDLNSYDPSEMGFKAPHFDEHGTNLLAHVRMNDRNVEGGKSLHLEEIQSDWHQQGRKQGYVGEKEKLQPEFDKIEEKLMASNDEKMLGLPKVEDVLKEAVDKKIITKAEADTYKRYTDIENGKPVPDAPFKKNWDELALKRMLHKAANEGYDAISWTPGEAQAARYDLSKQVDHIDYRKKGDKYELGIVGKNGEGINLPKNELTAKELEDHVGKEVAEKIINGEGKAGGGRMTLSNVDLKIGGEGMRSFYDKMLVDKANAIAKKYGSKVEQKEIGNNRKYWVDKIEKMNGDILYEVRSSENGGRTFKFHGTPVETKAEAEKQMNELKKGQPIHYLPITPELRAKAKEGFPLFSSVPTTIPVDYQPQFEDKKKYKLIPVEGNPFQ